MCFIFSSWKNNDQNILETVRTDWNLIDWSEVLPALFLKWHAEYLRSVHTRWKFWFPRSLFNYVDNRKTWVECVLGTDPVFYFLLQILFQTVTYERRCRDALGFPVNDLIWTEINPSWHILAKLTNSRHTKFYKKLIDLLEMLHVYMRSYINTYID